MRTKPKTRRPKPWDKDYVNPYGTYDGERGSSEQWAEAFRQRFTQQEIKEILGDDSPWGILGLQPGASRKEIRRAYAQKAIETHPDRNPQLKGDTAPFRKIQAAYEQLMSAIKEE